MSALPYPTPTRLRLADAIAAKEIRHYFWLRPWSRDTARDANVSARVNELVAAGLVEIPQPDGHDTYSIVVLTGAGREWYERAKNGDKEGEGPVSTSPETGPDEQHEHSTVDGAE